MRHFPSITHKTKQKVIGLMKDKLGGDIMTEFAVLRSKLFSFRKIDAGPWGLAPQIGRQKNVKESRSLLSRKLSDLRIIRIVSSTQPMSVDPN